LWVCFVGCLEVFWLRNSIFERTLIGEDGPASHLHIKTKVQDCQLALEFSSLSAAYVVFSSNMESLNISINVLCVNVCAVWVEEEE